MKNKKTSSQIKEEVLDMTKPSLPLIFQAYSPLDLAQHSKESAAEVSKGQSLHLSG
jgi:hypothetical protein